MFDSLTELKKWFYKNIDNVIAFHFDLTNIMLIVQNNYREGELYCSCDKLRQKCSLCKMSLDFSCVNKKGEERLERFQHNHVELKKIAQEMWLYLEEIFNTDQFALDIFRKEYSWSSRSRCGTYSYLSLQEIIDNNKYVETSMVMTNILNLCMVKYISFFLFVE